MSLTSTVFVFQQCVWLCCSFELGKLGWDRQAARQGGDWTFLWMSQQPPVPQDSDWTVAIVASLGERCQVLVYYKGFSTLETNHPLCRTLLQCGRDAAQLNSLQGVIDIQTLEGLKRGFIILANTHVSAALLTLLVHLHAVIYKTLYKVIADSPLYQLQQ